MRNKFSWSRYKALIRIHWVEHNKLYLWSTLVLTGLMFIWYAILLSSKSEVRISLQDQLMIFLVFLILPGVLLAFTVLAGYNRKPKATFTLMIPASLSEKFSMALTYVLIFFPIIYLCIFHLLNIPFTSISNAIIPEYNEPVPDHLKPVDVINIKKILTLESTSNVRLYLKVYLILISSAFLGSLYFRKLAFVKTTSLIIVLFLTVSLFANSIFPLTFTPDGWLHNFYSLTKHTDEGGYRVELSNVWQILVLIFTVTLIPLIMIISSFFQLKEIEV